MRALVVERHPFYRSALCELLAEFCDGGVMAVEDADSAFSLIARGEIFDLIVSDDSLLNDEGFKFIALVRAALIEAKITIVGGDGFINGDMSLAAVCEAAGVSFIERPIDRQTIRRHLN